MDVNTDEISIQSGSFKCRRDYTLATFSVLPPNDNIRSVIAFHHGFSEHSKRHFQVFRQLAAAGHAVYAYDCLGHGESGPEDPDLRAYIESTDDTVNDYLDFVKQVVIPAHPDLPVYSFGYSLGGMVAMISVSEEPSLFKGLMLHSPLIDLTPDHSFLDAIKEVLVRAVAFVAPRLGIIPRRPPSTTIRDAESAAEMEGDPLWDRRPVKAGTVAALLVGTKRVQSLTSPSSPGCANLTSMPIFVQHGTADISCAFSATFNFLEQLKKSANGKGVDVELVMVEGAYHDLAHDPETPKCIERLLDWLDRKVGN